MDDGMMKQMMPYDADVHADDEANDGRRVDEAGHDADDDGYDKYAGKDDEGA